VSLVIVGLPASGKSSVAEQLARRLGLAHLDTDAWIEERTGQTVADIFAADGEEAFRDLETEALRTLLAEPDAVVSVGGGAVLRAENRALLKGHEVVWLDVSVTTATRRAGLTGLRPLLLGDVRARLQALNAERRPLYAEVARHRVDSDRLNPGQAAQEVLRVTGRPARPPDDEEGE
jgi:shikimate kinase